MYELLPFVLTPERAEIISDVLRKVATTPTIFAHEVACTKEEETSCIAEGASAPEMCEACISRMREVSKVLGATTTYAFEVWSAEDLVGLIFFTNTTSLDAIGHYVFFDRDLASKTEIIQEAISEMWAKGLRRLTVEIPTPFAALASHAHRKLGFGGRFDYTLKGNRRLRIEGVKDAAAIWRDDSVDVLVMGLRRPQASET